MGVCFQFFEGNDGWAELFNNWGRQERNSFVDILEMGPQRVWLRWTYFGVNMEAGRPAYRGTEDFWAYPNGLILRRQCYESLIPKEHKGYAREPIELIGTAVDEPSGEGIPASGVAKVEVGGKGPGGQQLDWILAEDDSDADEEPWTDWSLDFLPDASGTYNIELRVWDEAGNFEIYDAGLELEFTISLAFQGDAYCWPNPVTNGVAHISFEINAPDSRTTTVKLLVYDVSGDLVYEEEHMEIPSRTRMSVEWNCRNAAGEKVVTGIYVFRLEAELDDQVANKVGKPMIIKN